MTTTVENTIAAGSVVKYHGSIPNQEWATFIVTAVNNGRATIHDREFPDFILSNVREGSITPTGETVDLCNCGHEYLWAGFRRDDELSCGATGCRCRVHTPNTILNAK